MSLRPTLLNLGRALLPRRVRNAMRRPLTTARRLLARLHFLGGKVRVITMRPDWDLRCHPICEPELRVFQEDISQKREMDEFISRCTNGMQLLDLGAHWGIFSLTALHYGGPGARTICVEPSAPAARILKANLRLNNAAERARLIEAAAGSHSGTLDMLTTGAGGADYYVVPSDRRSDTIQVPQVSASDIYRQYHFKPTHLKIDVEGYEAEVLTGAAECIQHCHPLIFLELHGELITRRGGDPRAVISILSNYGYNHLEANGQAVTVSELASSGFDARLICHPVQQPR